MHERTEPHPHPGPAEAPRERAAPPKPNGHGAHLPPLYIEPHDYPAAARALRDLLATHPRLFARANAPVILQHDADAGGLVARPLTAEAVTALAHEMAAPTLVLKLRGSRTYKPVTLPARVARIYLERGDWNLRPLAGIAGTPALREDGTIFAGDGYDPATGIYRENCPELHVPARPTRDAAEDALLTLRRFLRTWPFADAHRDSDGFVALALPPGQDESAALAGLLTATCRPSLNLAPATLARSPSISGAGCGKGRLARALAVIAYGREPGAMGAGHGPEEFDKRICSATLSGQPVILLDNLNGQAIRSDTLASLITERPARLRALGTSALTTVNAALWIVVTGNGVTLAEDLARRFIVCDLDALTEDPEVRRFPNDALAEARARRGELLAAALTIWRWGRQTGLPPGRPLGSFETWCRWCRDPLIALGCADPVERIASIKADDPHRRAVIEAFGAWWEAHRDQPVKATDLAEPVREALDPQGRGRQYLARRLHALIGTRAGGFTLEAARDGAPSKPVHLYRLRSSEGGGP
jgi:hypothetical protein